MTTEMKCKKCGGDLIGFDDCNGAECQECGAFFTDEELFSGIQLSSLSDPVREFLECSLIQRGDRCHQCEQELISALENQNE